MKKKFAFLLIFLVSIIPRVIFADICDQESITDFRKLAQDIQIRSTYIRDTSEIDSSLFIKQANYISKDVYLITISGMVDGLVAVDQDYNQFRSNGNYEVEFYVRAGEISFDIYVDECDFKSLRTISLNLLKFNKYSQNEYCQEFKDYHFDFCDEWYQGDLNLDILLEKLRPYYLEKEEEKESIFDQVFLFFQSHILLCFIIGGFLFLLVISFIIYHRRRSVLE